MPDYLRDPQEIYRRSYALIRAEADLSRLPEELRHVAVRLIHACGMVEIVDKLAWSADVAGAARAALLRNAPIFCDSQMVSEGIIRSRLPAKNPVLCMLDQPGVTTIAAARHTTRSAAALDLWLPQLAGAIVAIGNAPTALFRLLELLDDGAPRPAAILAFPVGFVGAAEAKAELAANNRSIPFFTLLGRQGGSALAAAAVNALAGEAGAQ